MSLNLPKPQKFRSKVLSKEKISSKVYEMRFGLIDPPEINFLPGQTVMLYVAPACAGRPGVNRSMSIASPPSEKNSILVAHDVSPGGVYSQWTINANVGDEMEFMGPLGIFLFDRESHRKKVFAATGTGIAPFRGILIDYLEHGGTDDVTLYVGFRHEEDVFWQKQFEELAQKYPNFRYVLVLSRPSDQWHGKLGHIEEHIFEDEKNLPGTDFYLCGNKPMVNEMRTKLKAAGVPDSQVKFEMFF